jgi:RimJ/RimL family protein N-acetyltransferase
MKTNLNHTHFSLRSFRADEWADLRDLRLRAVKAHSNLFLGSYETEAAFPDERWKSIIALEDGKVFGLYANGKLIGITGVFRNNHDPSGRSAKLGMSYIEPAYRGLGLSRLLYEVRLDWARAYGYERVIVSHRDGNEASRRANAVFGFKRFMSEDVTFGDGTTALDHRYELKFG